MGNFRVAATVFHSLLFTAITINTEETGRWDPPLVFYLGFILVVIAGYLYVDILMEIYDCLLLINMMVIH